MTDAFILTREWRDAPKGVRVELWVSTDDGPAKIIIDREEAVFFVAQTDAERARELLGVTWRFADVPLKSWKNQSLLACYNRSQRRLRDGLRNLTSRGIRVWEGDIRPPERYLMERFVFAGVSFDQKPQKSSSGYLELQQPRCRPSEYRPTLRSVSVDIETSMDAKVLYSIAVYGDCDSIVFIVQPDTVTNTPKETDYEETSIQLRWFSDQETCLKAFINWVSDDDPDVLMGWNVVQFDLWVLQTMCKRLGLPFAIGREKQEPSWRQANQGNHNFIAIPGRIALDGIELLKAAFYSFESFTLSNVATVLLGKGKLIEGQHRGEEIGVAYRNDILGLARYNLMDCQLVWEIFEKTELMAFAIERSQLTGLAMDKIGGSVAAFEYAYLPRLHRQGYVAPNLGELQSDVVSPGGYVMDSRPGLYKHVLVLDFKSLYPSIIRSFLIDPCAFWKAEHLELPSDETVKGFNEAVFSRQHHILPGVIADLWVAREQAKSKNNLPLSQAIKIIMNSFYGVLGSPGCRFFDPRVCSSITLRGHEILIESKQWIENFGYEVIYGDTDSVFVWLPEVDEAKADAIGSELALELNKYWDEKLLNEFQLESFMEIEFETHFLQFFMPTIRGSELGSKKRYAGVVKDGGKEKLVFKGLENVRTDWTMLARVFQEKLYSKIFKGEPYREFILEQVQMVLAGEADEQLVYRKRLRRHLQDYQTNVPPHAQAAKKLFDAGGEELGQGSWVSYLLTVKGPEPKQWQDENKLSPLNYSLYVERQLKPIADSILAVTDDSFDDIAASQLSLFAQ